MFATFFIPMCALAISLYGQARLAARKIRRHRTQCKAPPAQNLVLGHSDGHRALGFRPLVPPLKTRV